jgi:hypothetical protein
MLSNTLIMGRLGTLNLINLSNMDILTVETYFVQSEEHVIMDESNDNRIRCIVYPRSGHALTSTVHQFPLLQYHSCSNMCSHFSHIALVNIIPENYAISCLIFVCWHKHKAMFLYLHFKKLL